MLKCNAVRLIHHLSHRFKFYPPPDRYTNSSLWITQKDGTVIKFVCGIPGSDWPEYTIILPNLEIKVRGWKAVLKIVRTYMDKDRFRQVLRKHGIWNINEARRYESNWGTLGDKQHG